MFHGSQILIQLYNQQSRIHDILCSITTRSQMCCTIDKVAYIIYLIMLKPSPYSHLVFVIKYLIRTIKGKFFWYIKISIQSSPFHPNTLQWRHNGRDGVSNHQPHDCLLNRLFRRRSKKTSKLRVTGLCVRGIHRWPVNSPHKWPVTRKCFHLMTSSWATPKIALQITLSN